MKPVFKTRKTAEQNSARKATKETGQNASRKRTLKEDWKLLKRGLKMALEINSQYFICDIFCQMAQTLSPYFPLYMSARLINELSGACRRERLMLLAGITVLGQFAINAAMRMVQAKREIWSELIYRQGELFMFDRQHSLQYEHLENPDVSLMREQIFADNNASGSGLMSLFRDTSSLLGDGADLIASISLTVSIFRMTADAPATGILAFVNSHTAPACS